MGRDRLADSVLFAGVCMFVGRRVGWVGKILVTLIFHDHLHYCEIFLSRFLIFFVFDKAVILFGFEQSCHNFS